MIWPFAQRGVTRVYMRNTKAAGGWWVSTVYYDPWGRPYAYDGDWFAPQARNLNPDGTTDSYSRIWKHKCGPPVDFAGKHARETPI